MNKNRGCILVVDDEVGMRDMLSAVLDLRGYETMTAHDGLQALELVKNRRFNLVLSDVMMPHMDGITMAEEIDKINPDLKIIMFTGAAVNDSAIKAMEEIADDYILKPFDLGDLNARIEKMLVEDKK